MIYTNLCTNQLMLLLQGRYIPTDFIVLGVRLSTKTGLCEINLPIFTFLYCKSIWKFRSRLKLRNLNLTRVTIPSANVTSIIQDAPSNSNVLLPTLSTLSNDAIVANTCRKQNNMVLMVFCPFSHLRGGGVQWSTAPKFWSAIKDEISALLKTAKS